MTKDRLKVWSMSAQWTDQKNVWDRLLIAAYTLKDAKQLYVEVGGAERGIDNHFRNHTGLGGLRAFEINQRGCYFTDRFGKSVMFIEPKARAIIEEAPEEAKAAAAGQPIPDDYGRLRTGFTRGVRVDVWTYESPHADGGLADRLTAEVRMERVRRENEGRLADRRWASGIEFIASSKCFAEPLRDSDVEKLFAKVQAAFQTYELAQRGIVWEDWLHVHVYDEAYPSDGDHASGFKVTYEIIKRGVDPRDGKAYTIRDMNHVVVPFPESKPMGRRPRKDDEDDSSWTGEWREQHAYLPATSENLAALDAIIGAIESAKFKLAGLLSQGSIQGTLATIPKVPLIGVKDPLMEGSE